MGQHSCLYFTGWQKDLHGRSKNMRNKVKSQWPGGRRQQSLHTWTKRIKQNTRRRKFSCNTFPINNIFTQKSNENTEHRCELLNGSANSQHYPRLDDTRDSFYEHDLHYGVVFDKYNHTNNLPFALHPQVDATRTKPRLEKKLAIHS